MTTDCGVEIRDAEEQDLEDIIKLISDDSLGKGREIYCLPLPECYRTAFAEICDDKNSRLLTVSDGKNIIGCLQLTFTRCLSHKGMKRATIENVRIADTARGKGIGSRLIQYAVELARENDCGMVQLTTDKERTDAKRFYEKNGFKATHEGMKLIIER